MPYFRFEAWIHPGGDDYKITGNIEAPTKAAAKKELRRIMIREGTNRNQLADCFIERADVSDYKVKIEIFSNNTLQESVFRGLFKTYDGALKWIDKHFPKLDADRIAVNDQMLMGWDEWPVA